MQTFMPFDTFEASLFCLDYRRLGKQRLEAKLLLQILRGEKKSRWVHHPATRMWAGYEEALARYGLICCETWIARGFKDTQRFYFRHVLDTSVDSYYFPLWMGDEEFHRSHQENLVRKDPAYYGKLFPGIEPREGYVWPVGRTSVQHLLEKD